MKCIVTGAAGFVGSHLCEALLESGFHVIGIDNFSGNYAPSIKRSNIKNSLKNDNFKLIKSDILRINLNKIVQDGDVIFHLAAKPGVRQSWSDFQSYLKNNVEATYKILEACKGKSIKKLVVASSSSVYGNQDKLPVKEDAPLNPVSPYGVSKLACENLCRSYNIEFAVPIVLLRYFTVYGPRQRPDMFFNRAVKAALSNKPVEVYGNGKQTRDFTYVSDAVSATIQSAEVHDSFIIFNISGGSRISVNDTLKIMENNGLNVKTNYIETQPGDVKDTYGSTEKAKKLIKYIPKVSIEQGLKNEIEWLARKN